MKKKQPYVEQYQTCIFFARFLYYATFVGMDDPKFEEWEKVARKLQHKVPGFIGAAGVKKPFPLGKILSKILPYSNLFKLPFVGSYHSNCPRKAYQIWSKTIDDLGLTSEEMRRIIDASVNGPSGPEWDCFGERAWRLIEIEREYVPFVSEIKWIYNKLVYGNWFVYKIK